MSAATTQPSTATQPVAEPLSAIHRLVWAVAAVGFAFDTYEVVILSLIVRPAINSLSPMTTGSPEFNRWVGLLFYIPLAAGGIFGLLGGYLTDRFGRRRVLVWSILIYGGGALGGAYATSIPALLMWRCVTVVGVSVEFVAAIAWLAELFPEWRRRESILGYTQMVSAAGGFLATAGYYVAVTFGHHLPALRGGHDAWRYALAFGLAPAIPLMLVRPFLPESPVWQQQRAAKVVSRSRLSSLFAPAYRRSTIVSAALSACAFAIAYGVLQQTPRMVPGLPHIRVMAAQQQEQTVSAVHLFTDLGNVAGRWLFALLVVRMLDQRRLLRTFLIPGLVTIPVVYFVAARYDVTLLKMGLFVAAALMTAQLSFWGNYLPRVFPTHLRGTGESFATNIGGRVVGTLAALITPQLASAMPGAPAVQLASAAGVVGISVYAIAMAVSFWLPQPGEALPE
jgi:MFS family permease